MRTAPTGRTHSKRKRANRYLSKITKYLKWHQLFVNKYNITKFRWFNNTVSFRLHRTSPDGFGRNIDKDVHRVNWFKQIVDKIFTVRKKDQPLIIIGIKHFNTAANSSAVNMQYLKKNHWNSVFISNRTHKLKTLESQSLTNRYNSTVQSKNGNNCTDDHFNSLNPIEKAQILNGMLENKKFDIKYNYYYGTNALKTICIPIISGSTESTSSNEFLEFNKKVSLKLDSKLMKSIDMKVDFINNSHLRKRISKKYASMQSKRKTKFKLKTNKNIIENTTILLNIFEKPQNEPIIFDPFDKNLTN